MIHDLLSRAALVVALLPWGSACGGEAGSASSATGTAPARSAAASSSAATARPTGVAPSASASATPGPSDLAAPTRTDGKSGSGMFYLYWEPGIEVPGADALARAQTVLASARVKELLGAGPDDGFVFQKRDDAKGMLTFRQTVAWGGQAVVVDGAYATVQLEGGTKLVYVGTGFKQRITLSKDPLVVDEAKAGPIAEQEYERIEKAKGKVTPHLDPGLRVHAVAGKGLILGYAIHVERADQGMRPYMIVVDAQTGKAVDSRRSWVE
ncbi:MAG: hypothetical protein IPG04_18440 [Polyangiaceae bacterium]|jgi:hypothetical protein|nr:hypothetical protein [Polyangiaceae bacterium]